MQGRKGLYIQLISIHGLIRGEDPELGRDADTGGQILYVIDLAKALAQHPKVDRVELLTRQVFGKDVSLDYGKPTEQIAAKTKIIRIPCGPKRYLKKESLWPYLDSFIDQTLNYIHRSGQVPDVIHGHYADAGYVGSQVAHLLGVPFVFTGHSLGRVKKERLLAGGRTNLETLERRYNISARIEAEEFALNTASLVVASTHQEIEDQYKKYDYYQPARMEVIPPGIDLARFSPAGPEIRQAPIGQELARFLQHPEKPMVLTIARPDERKNLPLLVRAFAEHKKLRQIANLVLVAGNRQSFADLAPPQRKVLRTIMTLIDQYDLYGVVACPKQHQPKDVPDLYRLAAISGGVFINPALTEPFGLTLIEAAASGVPIIATNDGGPRDIIATCKNGFLIDPLNPQQIGNALYKVIRDKPLWVKFSKNGLQRSAANYSWQSHVERYIKNVSKVIKPAYFSHIYQKSGGGKEWISKSDRLLVTAISNILTGNPTRTPLLMKKLKGVKRQMLFGIASGRNLADALEVLDSLQLPAIDILIVAAGTEIYYGKNRVQDLPWRRHINYQWDREQVLQAMKRLKGLELQDHNHQTPLKVAYKIVSSKAPDNATITAYLRQKGLRVNAVFSRGHCVDIVPLRASVGRAIRYLSFKWNLPADRILAVGYAGSEEDMLSGDTLGVVVGQCSPELQQLRNYPRVYFADKPHIDGLLEGVEHYNFFANIRIPGEE